jgi:hypothetical protein
MNDPRPSDPESADTPLDATTERRVRHHLATSAEHVTLAPLEPARVRHTARQRTVRRHRAVVGGVAAATVMAMVGGVQVLSGTGGEGDGIRIGNGPDASATDVVGATPATSSSPNSGNVELQPAQLGEPAFVWKAVEVDQSQSIVSTFGASGSQSFPGLALSTAPGRSNDYDNITPSVWRTADGVSWEQTDLGLPFGAGGVFDSIGSQGRLFALGTAPGIAATDPNPLQVAVAGIDSSDWTTIDLPFDTNAPADVPFVVESLERSMSPVDGGVLVSITPSADVDVVDLADASDRFDIDQFLTVGPNGIEVTADGCTANDVATVTTIAYFGNSGTPATVPDGTTPGTADECGLVQLTWDEVGMPAESVAALQGNPTMFYLVDAAGTVTPVDPPTPEAQFAAVGNGSSADYVVFDRFGSWAPDGLTYRYANGAWTTSPMVFNNWATVPQRLGDATLGFGYPSDGRPSGPVFAVARDDGSASFVDTDTLFDDNSIVSHAGAAVAAGHLVSTVSTTPDGLAAAGGAEFTVDGLTVRQERLSQPPIFIDAATGATIPESDLRYGDDDTITARNADGDVIGTVRWEDINRLAEPYYDTSGTVDWSILTTADGVTFARESVAELLGIEPADISYVPQVYSDGTQVVVVVTLNERYPDESRKQISLVGTPIG